MCSAILNLFKKKKCIHTTEEGKNVLDCEFATFAFGLSRQVHMRVECPTFFPKCVIYYCFEIFSKTISLEKIIGFWWFSCHSSRFSEIYSWLEKLIKPRFSKIGVQTITFRLFWKSSIFIAASKKNWKKIKFF